MKRRVLITCSAAKGVPSWWFSSYDQVLRQGHADYDFEFAVEEGNNAINLSRNIAAHAAMEQNYWKHVQIDADQLWTPAHLVRLVSHNEDIVALPYCKKTHGPVKWLMVRKPAATARPDGLLACDFMGTGMISCTVEALRRICAFSPEREFLYDDDTGKTHSMFELFPIGLVGPNTAAGRLARVRKLLAESRTPDGNYPDGTIHIIESILKTNDPRKARMLGEDYHFCHLARKAGLSLYCDTTICVGHVGPISFPIGEDITSEPNQIPTHTLALDEW